MDARSRADGASLDASLDSLSEPLRALRGRFEAEVEPHRRALWRYCLRLTGSPWDAEDLVQETMQRALSRLADLWQPVHPRAYLFRVATNAWIDRRRRDVAAELRELPEELPGGEAPPERAVEAHEALAHVVSVLTPLQRVVFLLCETLDFRAGEAAALIGTTEGAVKAALHRARRALADRRPGSGASGASLVESARTSPLVRRYIEAFDARDPEALAALLDEDAVTAIVGVAEELGREVTRRGSLAEWAQEAVPQWARAGMLDGREVLFVVAASHEGEEALYSLVELEVAGHTIRRQRIYFYSPELLEYVATLLGMRAITHGHRYAPGGSAATGSSATPADAPRAADA